MTNIKHMLIIITQLYKKDKYFHKNYDEFVHIFL